MSAHPMLTKALADGIAAAFPDGGPQYGPWWGTKVAPHVPHAERLEAALDVCGHVREDGIVCGRKRGDYLHQEPRTRSVFRHEYQPLVAA